MGEQSCAMTPPDLSAIETVERKTAGEVGDFQAARKLAESVAGERFNEYMLLSWYDRERDAESPGHVSECGGCGPKQGYIHYAVNRGARLRVEVDGGRFVFFYTPVEW